MIYSNPTPVKVGMDGVFFGKHYRIVGRVVFGVEQSGQTYYWNEFNLVDDSGESVTLVYEETDQGPQWKWFTLFTPKDTFTATHAATCEEGDWVDLDGMHVRVTLVAESRLYHIEGTAPAGQFVGEIARYFNSERAGVMLVVSWIGEVIEFYRGRVLPLGTVARALGLPRETMPGAGRGWGPTHTYDAKSKSASQAVVIIFATVFLLGMASIVGSSRRPAPFDRVAAPTSVLSTGTTGTVEGVTYQVREHSLVEVAQMALIYGRQEYQLTNDSGASALLVFGFTPGKPDWCLFTPLEPMNPLTPQGAAALRFGDRVSLDGLDGRVTELFRSTVKVVDFANLQWPDVHEGDVFYDFSGKAGDTPLLVRWNANQIGFYKGSLLDPKEVAADFHLEPGK